MPFIRSSAPLSHFTQSSISVTKLADSVYAYKNMSVEHFDLILKNKMAAMGFFGFPPHFFSCPISVLGL